MRLEEMLKDVQYEHLTGRPVGEVVVRHVTSDSRQAGRGVVFVAVPGTSRDGHDYVLEAARAGSEAVLVERWVEGLDEIETCTVLRVNRARAALALCAANLHGRPGERLHLVGVTGTNGKTTVAWLLASVAEHSGRDIGVIGTLGVRRRAGLEAATHTTPGPEALQELLAGMLRDGADLAVMEVSSHALDQERALGCRFMAAGFTGLSRDHLDYHPDMEHYFTAKTRLFTEHLAPGGTAVLLVDDPFGQRLFAHLEREGRVKVVPVIVSKSARDGAAAKTVVTVGTEATGVRVISARLSLTGIQALFELPGGDEACVDSSLVGEHNVANLAMAAGLARAVGFTASEIGRGLSGCAGVAGRLERVTGPEGDERHLFVDYAHTDDALTRVILTLRESAPEAARLFVVVGCGGDRDRGKRPLMARAASLADAVVLTSDNPRSEDPAAIVRDMLPGLDGGAVHAVELDRREAIRMAVGMARQGDVILVAGKGHEACQVVGKEATPFDDREVSREALATVAPGTRLIPSGSSEAGSIPLV